MNTPPPPEAAPADPPAHWQVTTLRVARLEEDARALTGHLEEMGAKVNQGLTHIEVMDALLKEMTAKVGRMTHALWATTGSLLLFALTMMFALSRMAG